MSQLKMTVQSSTPTASAGVVYLDDGTNTASGAPQWRYYDGASWHDLGEASSYKKASSIASATVANTVTETSIIGTLKTGDSLQFGANTLAVGNTIRVTVRGIISNTGTPTLNLIIKLGATTIVSCGAITTPSGLSNTGFYVTADLTVRSIGASGTIAGAGMAMCGSGSASPIDMLMPTPATPVTIDTTGALTLDVTATWGTASASNTITGQTATVEVLV